MKPIARRRCKGSLYPGRRAPFGRVICAVCAARLMPLAGGRAPNHKSDVDPPAASPPVSEAGPPRATRK